MSFRPVNPSKMSKAYLQQSSVPGDPPFTTNSIAPRADSMPASSSKCFQNRSTTSKKIKNRENSKQNWPVAVMDAAQDAIQLIVNNIELSTDDDILIDDRISSIAVINCSVGNDFLNGMDGDDWQEGDDGNAPEKAQSSLIQASSLTTNSIALCADNTPAKCLKGFKNRRKTSLRCGKRKYKQNRRCPPQRYFAECY